jgi:hypothetical protein
MNLKKALENEIEKFKQVQTKIIETETILGSEKEENLKELYCLFQNDIDALERVKSIFKYRI